MWLLVFAFVCRLDGGTIGLDGMGAMAGCEYSVHDMTLRRCKRGQAWEDAGAWSTVGWEVEHAGEVATTIHSI